MKIEIDLNDILGDEEGAESLQDSVRRQVVEAIVKRVGNGINAKIDKAVNETITAALNAHLKEKLPALIDDMLDQEFQPVGRYGDISPKTTIRNEIARAIQHQCKYEPKTYSSDETTYTRVVREELSRQCSAFQKNFNSTVDAEFTKQALIYAQQKLAEKLGIKA